MSQTKWASNFRKRLEKTIDWCTGEEPLNSNHRLHLREFSRRLGSADRQYMEEIQKLNPFEFSLYSMSSTKKQLEEDEGRFTAREVRNVLFSRLLILNKERFVELDDAISNMHDANIILAYEKSKRNSNTR